MIACGRRILRRNLATIVKQSGREWQTESRRSAS